MKQRLLHTCLIVAAIMSGTACSEDAFQDGLSSTPSAIISFAVNDDSSQEATRGETPDEKTVQVLDATDGLGIAVATYEWLDAPQTRGTVVNETNINEPKFDIFGYQTKGDQTIALMHPEKYTQNGTEWVAESGNIYYWMGADYTYDFAAISPAGSSADGKVIEYTVPTDIPSQKDLLVAENEDIAGDFNSVVPLDFKHICSAVRIVSGPSQLPGRITKVELKGILNKGTYSLETDSWTLDESATATFAFEPQHVLSSTSSYDMTDGNMTLLMLPQTLPESAQLVVTVLDNASETITLTHELKDFEWVKNKTHVYTLTINANYKLEFTDELQVMDAHYEVDTITIKAEDVPGGEWMLTSSDPNNVTFVEKGTFASNDLQSLVNAGYWLYEHCGTSKLTSSSTGDVTVYVFLKENVTEDDRNIKLTLKPTSEGYGADEFSFTQYCPAWKNNIGVERIQEKDYPWGFNWNSDMKVTYDFTNNDNFFDILFRGVLNLYLRFFSGYDYIKVNGIIVVNSVTINFGELGELKTADDADNGLSNTWEIYNFQGINEASTLMDQLESWGGTPDNDLTDLNPSEFAARACAMKNMYGVTEDSNASGTVYLPVLTQDNMVWYLPAQNEAPSMVDDLYGLSGDYWTSTAIPVPGDSAYKYTAGTPGIISGENRNTKIHVRAVRKKQ